MDKQFFDIYNGLYAEYVYDFGYPRRRRQWFSELESETSIIREVRRSIEFAEMEIDRKGESFGISLRPDAKFFLLTNFHLMVIRPLIDSDNRLWDQTRVERNLTFSDFIGADISAILHQAYSSAMELGIKEISGHTIMRAIDKQWPELKLSNFRIWGDDK